MKKRTKFNKFLSLILAISMIIGVCPISVFANESTNNINLSMQDVNENQDVFSKSYMFNDELKTLYAYNTDNGTCKITGDIPYAGGTFGNISVRNEKGYLEFPFTLSDLEVVCFTNENSAKGCSVLFLTKDNELRNFTFVEEAWNKIENSGNYIPKPSVVTEYEAPIIYSNIKKLEKNFFIDNKGVFRVYAGNLVYDIANDVDDFIFLGNNTIKVTYKSGDIDFANVDNLWGGFIDNLPSPFDNSEVIGGHYGFEKVNYLSFKNESDGSLTIIPSEDYLNLNNLLATSGLESLNLSKENASSVDNNTYIYNLFNNNVILGVILSDKDVVCSLNISTSDNSTPILLGSGIDTKFGKIEFKFDIQGNSYSSMSLYTNNYNVLNDNANTILSQAFINRITGDVYNKHNLFIKADLDWDWDYNIKFKVDGCIFQSGYDLGDYIIDLYVNYDTKEAKVTNRNTGIVYDISSSIEFDSGYTTEIGSIIEDKFEIYGHRSTGIFPNLYYDSSTNYIVVSIDPEYGYGSKLKTTLNQTYSLKNTQLEDLISEDYAKYIWHLYNLHCIMRTTSNREALKYSYINRDISYILKTYFDIDISCEELSTNTSSKYSKLSSDAVYTALYINYLLEEGCDDDATKVREIFINSYNNGIYTQDWQLVEELNSFNIDYIIDIYIYYLLCTENSFEFSNLVHTYTDEIWNNETDKYDYVDYEVKQLPYEGYYLSSTSLILQEQAPLYTTVCPCEYSSFMITDTSVTNKNYYALGTNGVLYNISFNYDYLSEGLSNSWEFNDTSTNTSIMSQIKIAENVVKVNSLGHYLTSNGKLYTKDGVLLKEGVTNISDNLYEFNGTWYYITSNTEFKFNYASDKNIRPLISKSTNDYITYQFMFNEDISYIVSPNGEIIKNGGTYTIDTNGYYVFEVVNSYGDEFTEILIVNHLGTSGIVGITPMVVDKILSLHYEPGAIVEYSFDDSTWLTYNKKIDITDKNTIYFKGYSGDTDLGKYKLTIDDNSKVNLYNISPADFNPDNFCGLGYIKDGALFNSLNKIEVDGVTEVSMLDADNFVYLDDDGNLLVSQKYGDASNYSQAGFMPVFRSNKIEFESDVTNPIDIHTDGLYTYLLGDSGNLVSVNLGDMVFTEEVSTYNYNIYMDWEETWLSSDVVKIHNGVAYKIDGSTINLDSSHLSEQEMLDNIKALEFYDKNDNLISPPIITTFRNLGGKIYVLTSTLDVYSGYIKNGQLDYNYTIDLEAQNIDFIVEETDWLNTNSYGIEFTLPNDYEVYAIPNYQTSTPYTLSALQQNTFGMTDSGLLESYVAYRDGGNYSGEPYCYYIKTKDMPLELSFVLFDSQYYVNSPISIYNIINDTYLTNFTTDIVTDNDTVYNNMEYDEYLGGYTTGWFKYTYTLEPNTIYNLNFYSATFLTDLEGNMFRINGAYSSLEDYMYIPSYIDIESNFGDKYSTEELSNNNFKFTPSTNGTYNIVLKNSLDKTVSKGRVKIGNLDIYKPKLTNISYNNGVITPTFDDVDDETGKTSKSGVWTLEYSSDNGVSWNTFEGGLTYSPSTTFNLRRNIVVTEPQVKVRATDKAGNVSDVYTINLDMSIYEYYIYENGKTTVKFYANDDSSWNDTSLSYSYNVGAGYVNGYEFSVLTDTNAILKADKDDIIPSSTQKPIDIEVVVADKTNTSLTDDVVTVKTGNYINANFFKLYVNIDRMGYQEYTLEEMSRQLGVGSHIIESYYEVEKDGQIIKSLEDLVVVTIPDTPMLNDTIIHTNITYENGTSTLTFYANDDTNNTEFNYSYIINGNENSGHRVVVTEDTLVELKATKIGYKDGEKLVNIVVLYTEKPIISDLTNNKYVTVTKGNIKNATLDKIVVDVDGTITEVTTSSQILELLAEGTHNIKAYQIVKAFIDGKLITITSLESTKTVNITNNTPLKYTLIIRDHFDNDIQIRSQQVFDNGQSYNVKALNIDGWNIIGNISYSGTITKDLVIDFYYEKNQTTDKEIIYHNLIVKDKFDNDVTIRIEKILKDGENYNFEALSKEGWSVVGKTKYEGTINSDLVIEFEYKKEIVPPIDNDEPIIEPPKTGDSTNLSLWLIMLCISASILLVNLFKRKRSI